MKKKIGLVVLLTLLVAVGITFYTKSNLSQAGDVTDNSVMTVGKDYVAADTNGEYVDVQYKFTPQKSALYALYVWPYENYESDNNIFFEYVMCGSENIHTCDEYYGYYLEKGKEYDICITMYIEDEFNYYIDYAADGYENLAVTPSMGRVYFDNSKTKWSNVHVWIWDEDEDEWSNSISGMSVWPGPKAGYDDTIGKYYYDIPKIPGDRLMVIFNSGLDKNTGEALQTVDMICPGAGYELNGTTKLTDSDKYSGTWIKAKKKQTITASNYTKTYGNSAFNVVAKSNLSTAKITFSSSNTKVVTVDANSGKTTIKGAGSAYITVKGSGDNTYYTTSKKIKITVNKANQTITASNYTKTFSNGSTFSINAKLSKGNGKLTYATSDKNVVTIDSKGKVKIIGNGKATITITAAATTNYNKATKKVTVTVKPATQSITSAKSSVKNKMTVSWKKDTKVTGYQIQYSTSKNFSSGIKYVNVTSNKTISKTISGLTSGKTYYVRVRSYRTYAKVNYYGNYSGYKTVKVK